MDNSLLNMEKGQGNGKALAGFIVSCSALPLFAAALLCTIGVMLTLPISFAFTSAALLCGAAGIALSSVGLANAAQTGRGTGFALAGMLTGTSAITLALALNALSIVLLSM